MIEGVRMNFLKKAMFMSLFATLAAVTAFAAGGKDTKSTFGSGKIVVKALAHGDSSDQEGKDWIEIVQAFEKANPNIKIDYELLADKAYDQQVISRLASNDVPDIAYMGGDPRWAKPWREARQQFDIKPYLDPKIFDLSLIPTMGPNGEMYELPLGTSNLSSVAFVNVKLLKELGFDIPKTYEDLVKMVPAAKAKGLEVVGTHGADGWCWGSCILSGIIARTSGDAHWVAKAQSGQVKFTDPAFVSALSVLQTMVRDGVLSSKSVLVDNGTANSNYSKGKYIVYLTGQWDSANITPEAQEFTRLIAFPTLPGEKGNGGSVAGAILNGYGITQSGTKNPAVRDAALKFLVYLNSDAWVTQRLIDGTITAPVLKGYKDFADMSNIAKEKASLGMNTKIITDIFEAYFASPEIDAINAGCQKIVSGTATPTQVAAEVEGFRK